MATAPRRQVSRPLRPAARGPARAAGVDAVTTEIILGAFETICYEMATHVSLTATTPILNQSNERNATILDAAGQLAALSVGIPQFMLSSTLPVRFAVEFFGPDGLHDGDVLVRSEIILGAFETICYEMATHVSLTATTPILNQSNERNATILDAAGQLAALSVGIPQFMLSSTLPVRFAVEFFGPDGLHDGDVLVRS